MPAPPLSHEQNETSEKPLALAGIIAAKSMEVNDANQFWDV